LPGVTAAWLAHANGVTVKTIERWKQQSDPADVDLTILTPELGLEMALLRPPGSIMPMWSRMAMAEYAANGMTYAELSELFRCGKSTVWRCVKRWPGGYAPLSGKRLLTPQQRAPVRVRANL
jgi:transposase